MDDFRAKQKHFALQKDLSHALVQLELKADLNDVNESFSAKANKSTVANALHRKANKGETEDALKEKIDKKELNEILESFKRDIENTHSIILSKEKESLVKIDHFREIEDIILRKADKVEIDMYLSAVNTQKKDFDRRIQLIEKETAEVLKTVQSEIEGMRTSCIEILGRKADISEFDRLNEEVHSKLGTDSVINLINTAKSDLYIAINDIKEEFLLGQKKYEENLFERASRAEINSEKTIEELHITRKEVEEIRQITVGIEKDTIEYSKNMYEASRNEMKQETGRIDTDFRTFKVQISQRVDNSLLTAEFEKFKEENGELLENKVDVDEVQRAITGCQNDSINRIGASKNEILKVVDNLNSSILPILSKKVDQEELEVRISDLICKNELNSELEAVNNHLIKDIRNLYSMVENKTDRDEFIKERDNVGEIVQNIENELGNKINEEDARDIINQK